MPTRAAHHYVRLRTAAAKYRDARQALHTPSSAQSRRGLDWMNFFIADVQTGFGTFVAFYLAQMGWAQGSVGAALAAGTITGVEHADAPDAFARLRPRRERPRRRAAERGYQLPSCDGRHPPGSSGLSIAPTISHLG
jgi:hypothetical protein